jgi:hypothetical protein
MKPKRKRDGDFTKAVVDNYVKDLVTFVMVFGIANRNKLSRRIVISTCRQLSKYSEFSYPDMVDLFNQVDEGKWGFYTVKKIDPTTVTIW